MFSVYFCLMSELKFQLQTHKLFIVYFISLEIGKQKFVNHNILLVSLSYDHFKFKPAHCIVMSLTFLAHMIDYTFAKI